MARKLKPIEPPEDVPKWFMTYSDVITLLMTFFILLLTFATNDPERFEKMKVSMFGGSGSSGFAGTATDGLDRDSLVARIRPDASRKATRGSEMPPIDRDTSQNSLDKGLSGLDRDTPSIDIYTLKLSVPAMQLASANGDVLEYGEKTLGMIAKLSRQRPFEIYFETNEELHLPRIMGLVEYLISSKLLPPDRIAVQHRANGDNMKSQNINIVIQFSDGVLNAQRTSQSNQ